MNRLLISLTAAIAFSALSCTTTQTDPLLEPLSPGAVAGKDVTVLVSEATQAYMDYKAGNVNLAWAITHGAQAYSTIVKTAADVKEVVKSWGGNTGDSQKFADRLVRIFQAKRVTDPKEQARLVAEVVPVAIASRNSP